MLGMAAGQPPHHDQSQHFSAEMPAPSKQRKGHTKSRGGIMHYGLITPAILKHCASVDTVKANTKVGGHYFMTADPWAFEATATSVQIQK